MGSQLKLPTPDKIVYIDTTKKAKIRWQRYRLMYVSPPLPFTLLLWFKQSVQTVTHNNNIYVPYHFERISASRDYLTHHLRHY